MNFILFKLTNERYLKKNWEDPYLNMLADIFEEGPGWRNAVKGSLLDKESQGIIGNKAEIDIKGNCVLIMPQFVDDPEEYAIEIDKNVLLALIEKWEALVKQKTPEIYFIRYDDGRVEIQGHVPAE